MTDSNQDIDSKLDDIYDHLMLWHDELSKKLHSIEYAGNMPNGSAKYIEHKKIKDDMRTCMYRLDRFEKHRPLRYKSPVKCMCCL